MFNSYLIIQKIWCIHRHGPIQIGWFAWFTLQAEGFKESFKALRIGRPVYTFVCKFAIPSSRCGIGVANLIVTNPSKHLRKIPSNSEVVAILSSWRTHFLLFLLVFRLLPEAAFARVCDVKGMVSGRVGAVVATLDDESVRLAPFHRDFWYEEVVDVPGYAPGWLPGDGGVAAFAPRRAYFC